MRAGKCLVLDDDDVLPGEGPVMGRLTREAFFASSNAIVVVYNGQLIKNRLGEIQKRNRPKKTKAAS